MTYFTALRVKQQSYLTDDNNENKKEKGTKRYVKKESLNLKVINIVLKQLNLRIEKN